MTVDEEMTSAHVAALAASLIKAADEKDPSAFEAYDTVGGLMATQYMLEGNGPSSWATVVQNEDSAIMYVIVETSWGSSETACVFLYGATADAVGRWLIEVN